MPLGPHLVGGTHRLTLPSKGPQRQGKRQRLPTTTSTSRGPTPPQHRPPILPGIFHPSAQTHQPRASHTLLHLWPEATGPNSLHQPGISHPSAQTPHPTGDLSPLSSDPLSNRGSPTPQLRHTSQGPLTPCCTHAPAMSLTHPVAPTLKPKGLTQPAGPKLQASHSMLQPRYSQGGSLTPLKQRTRQTKKQHLQRRKQQGGPPCRPPCSLANKGLTGHTRA